MTRSLRLACCAAAVLALSCGQDRPAADAPVSDTAATAAASPNAGVLAPPGMKLPYRIEPACPGEGCTYGEWLACDTVILRAAAGDTAAIGRPLLPGERFTVVTGVVLVEVPDVVVVTQPTRQAPYSINAVTFQPGDTLFVLDYVGEGFFRAWYRDSILEVDVFWPWDRFYPAPDFQYGGTVVQPGSRSFWVRTDRTPEAWVPVDAAKVAAPSALDPDPPVCR